MKRQTKVFGIHLAFTTLKRELSDYLGKGLSPNSASGAKRIN